MITDTNIREATKDDAGVIARVVLLAIGVDLELTPNHDSPFNYELVKALAEREDSQYSYKNCYIYEVGSEVAGVICSYDGGRLQELRKALFEELEQSGRELGKEITDECEKGELYIDSLAVFKEYRGRGIASKLIDAVYKKAQQLKISKLGLLLDDENHNAATLYQKLGFVYVGINAFLGTPMNHLQKDVTDIQGR